MVRFSELPNPAEIPTYLNYNSQPEEIVFHIFTPKNFDPTKTYGYLGWLDSSDSGVPPKKFEDLYDKNNLIVVGAEKAACNIDFSLSIPLAIRAMLEVSKMVPIDPKRHFLFGTQGGGSACFIAPFCYPDLINGVIGMGGIQLYRDVSISGQHNMIWPGYWRDDPQDTPNQGKLKLAKSNVGFALVNGEHDGNLSKFKDYIKAMKQEHFKFTSITDSAFNRGLASPEALQKALDFIAAGSDGTGDF